MMTPDVIVVGAGALGAATAAELSRRGASVRLLAPEETSASQRAAGMLAPAFESVLDGATAGHADLLKQARDLWPAMAAATRVVLHREGAEWRGPDAAAVAARLEAMGFEARTIPDGVFTPDDWRLDPAQALEALTGEIPRIERRMIRLKRTGDGFELSTDGGEVVAARQVVLASGWLPVEAVAGVPPIIPIKGQAVRLSGRSPAHVIRAEGVYVAPAPGGAVVGATMEEGASDLDIDEAVIADLLERAWAAAPELAGSEIVEAYAAVRGASPDGLPYAGLIAPGLAVALAPRRNGWLLAPMVARTVADALESGGQKSGGQKSGGSGAIPGMMDPSRPSPG